ncbi:MAG: hypothetical protein A2096_17060 [Spirochaetes bacterium GWF1_41_5]|nr:MAG: hypothetical protein A2096_17060 [Spirochaetes bacterium GWF1_41_5]HBE00976.1 thioredoxin [Spirochaetia bacterium]
MKKFLFLSGALLLIALANCSSKTEAGSNKQGEGGSAAAADYQVTFVELGSVNCIPCKMMQPIMKEIEEQYKGKVKVVFYDVWTPEGRKLAEPYKIRVIPTQVFLDKNGREYFRHEGFFPKDELIKALEIKLK